MSKAMKTRIQKMTQKKIKIKNRQMKMKKNDEKNDSKWTREDAYDFPYEPEEESEFSDDSSDLENEIHR